MKNKILELKAQGLKPKQILINLGINKNQYYYYMSESVREAQKKAKNKLKSNPYWPLIQRIYNFKNDGGYTEDYNYTDVIKKYGEKPRCYLTGREIDYLKPETYQLDHILPLAKGGTSDLFNLGLCCPQANQAKSGLYLNDFYTLCAEILVNRVEEKEEF